MIDIKELRRLAQGATPGPDGVSLSWIKLLQDFQQGANPAAINELLDRLEAAERERDECNRRRLGAADHFAAQTALMKEKYDALRTKVEAMERQEPYAFAVNFPETSRVELVHNLDEVYEDMTYEAYEVRKLYLAPGAHPAPMAVAYLDIGANGYMDIGTDLTDEELDTIPKGRHMLGIVGTYGIEGYVPAQPAPSVPEGWKLVPTAESRHPGIHKMLNALHAVDNTPGASEWESYAAFLAAAPEAKP